jgi:formate dehydrogenase iron-sulfur subunit
METIDRIVAARDNATQMVLLRDLCDTMKSGSLCALGGFVPYPVLSAIDHFPEDFSPQ